MNELIIRPMEEKDIPIIVDAFIKSNWTEKPASTFYQYLNEKERQERMVWVAYIDNEFIGYITLKWTSGYSYFSNNGIPEINDLNVLPLFRNKGVGSALLGMAEEVASEKSDAVGLGVGLYADYGNAQRLYIRRGYIPDGRGLTYKNRQIKPGNQVIVDDELLLWMVKKK